MTAMARQRDQPLGALEAKAVRNLGRGGRPRSALEPSGVDVGDRGEARRVANIERQQLAALPLRTLLRNCLSEAERSRKGESGGRVAPRKLLQHEGVQYGRLFVRR